MLSLILLFIILAGLITTIFLKTWLPVIFAVSLLFIIRPVWWTLLFTGLIFSLYLQSGWPLLAAVIFYFIGKPKRWWPIPAGIAFALVEVYSFYLSERPLGITRGYTVTGAIIEYLFNPDHVDELPYWNVYEPYIDWTMALILGTTLGSFISSKFSGEFKIKTVPDLWKISKGSSIAKRWMWTFLSGVLMGFAARVAGGCVSGLLISGTIQLAPSGFIFMMSLWIGGVVTTILFYRTEFVAVKRE